MRQEESVKMNKKKLINQINIYRSVLILLVICVFATILSPSFLSVTNLFNVFKQITVAGIVGCGMTFVILTGGIDLSVGSILGLSGVLASGVLASTGNTAVAVAVSPTVGIACGAGIPVPVIILIIVFLLAHYILTQTSYGRSVYAVGGNREAARLSGIRVKTSEFLVYTLNGLMCGMAGLILTARLGSAQSTSGTGIEMDAIAAVILGGTSLSGGVGFVLPTVVGAMIMGIIDNILTLMNVNPHATNIVKGAVILIAVLVDKKVKDLSAKAE